MAHTHEFDCKQCGAHLDSREELAEHTRQKHSASAQTEPGSAQRDSSSQRDPGSPNDVRQT
jgi:hypothetical protein